MKDYIFYILVLIILALSFQNLKAQDDFDDWDSYEEIEEEYVPLPKLPSSIFKPMEIVEDNKPGLVVTICYNDDERGYYCKDLP